MSTATVTTAKAGPVLRRAAVATTIGTAIEFYEFTVYGFLTVIFAPLIFPSTSPAAATLSALAVYGGGYLARPLGGLFFGALGDRIGRRPVLMATIFLMGGATMLIGFVPTFAQVGILAPILLLVLRLIQGFSAGGEFAGAQTYIVEMAPAKQRAFYGSLPAFGIGMGFSLGALVVATVFSVVPGPSLAEYGWRIPFLLAIPFTLVCLFLRLRLEDSPEFRAIIDSAEVTRTPIRDVFRYNLPAILRIAALTISVIGPAFLVKLYMGIYLVQVKGLNPALVYFTLAIVLALSSLVFPLAGRISDRVGRRPIIIAGAVAFLVFSVPLFMIVSNTDNIVLIGITLFVFMLIEPFMSGAVYTSFAEMLPGRVRYTGISVGFNVGTIVAAGFGPLIAAQLASGLGSPVAPGLWGMAAGLLGLLIAIWLRDANQQALRR